jgi:hypothetical protein
LGRLQPTWRVVDVRDGCLDGHRVEGR